MNNQTPEICASADLKDGNLEIKKIHLRLGVLEHVL
jgi:hypothetical protein